MPEPSRGDVWLVNLDPTRGHEQGGQRPALVVSVDLFDHGPAGLVVVLPITSRPKGIPFHVEVMPPDRGGDSAELREVRGRAVDLQRAALQALGRRHQRDHVGRGG